MKLVKPLKSGKKALVAENNNQGLIEIRYEPAGGTLPKMLSGKYTSFQAASRAIDVYMSQFKE